jgi:hypothetical protein
MEIVAQISLVCHDVRSNAYDDAVPTHPFAIPVESYPLSRTYGSFEAAIHGAFAHPRQPKATNDTSKLAESRLLDGCWTEDEFALHFTNGRWLFVYCQGRVLKCADDLNWEVLDSEPNFPESRVKRVGEPPVICAWGPPVGEAIMDPSSLISGRLGADFVRLFVNEGGLLIYFKQRPILHIAPVRRTDLNRPMLWIGESE